ARVARGAAPARHLHQRPAHPRVPVPGRDLRLRPVAHQGVRDRAEPRRAAEDAARERRRHQPGQPHLGAALRRHADHRALHHRGDRGDRRGAQRAADQEGPGQSSVTVKFQVFILSFVVAGIAYAAPPADPELVDLWSHTDELNAANRVPKAAAPRALKRARSAPDLGLNSLLNDFLDANQNTGLLVLKGDTVVAERYQYGRTAQHRFASASMAKTVLGMLVGIAVHERKIASIGDRAEKYVPALK